MEIERIDFPEDLTKILYAEGRRIVKKERSDRALCAIETLDLNVLNSQEAHDLFVEFGKKEVEKEIIREKWKCISYDMLADQEIAQVKISMWLEPFTSDDAKKNLDK